MHARLVLIISLNLAVCAKAHAADPLILDLEMATDLLSLSHNFAICIQKSCGVYSLSTSSRPSAGWRGYSLVASLGCV